MCPRKWAWNKIDGLQSPPNKYAEMGTQVHSHLETWLKHRKLPAIGEAAVVANAMIPHLPPPQAVEPHDIEREFQWRFQEVAFRGFIDLIHFDSSKQVPVTIYDHKTTSDLQWAKTAEDLGVDVQATLYARVLMDQTSTDVVQLQWTYATRKARPQVLPVRRLITRDEILPRVSQTVASAREMQSILNAGCTAIEVPYDASACDAFGGCPFRPNCNLTTQQKFQSAMTQENQKNSFLQRLQARKAGTSGAAPATFAVNPPEAAAPVAPPMPTYVAPEPALEVQDIAEQIAEVTAAVAEPFKRGRGRPRKDESAPVAAVAAPAPAPTVAKANIVGGWTLYLDCQPVKGAVAEHISERLARVMLEYTAETGQSHYKLTEYGKGPAIFAEGFAKDLAANPPKSGVIAHSASQEVRDVLQVLMENASAIVQG